MLEGCEPRPAASTAERDALLNVRTLDIEARRLGSTWVMPREGSEVARAIGQRVQCEAPDNAVFASIAAPSRVCIDLTLDEESDQEPEHEPESEEESEQESRGPRSRGALDRMAGGGG